MVFICIWSSLFSYFWHSVVIAAVNGQQYNIYGKACFLIYLMMLSQLKGYVASVMGEPT
jgi:hypothetical protein